MRKISLIMLVCLVLALVGCSLVETPTAGEIKISISEESEVENDLEVIVRRTTGAEMSLLLKADENYEKVVALDFGDYTIISVRDITDTVKYEIEQIPFDLSEQILKREIILNISKGAAENEILEGDTSLENNDSKEEIFSPVEPEPELDEVVTEPENIVEIEDETVVDNDSEIIEEIKKSKEFTDESSTVWVTESVNIRKEPHLEAEILGVFTSGMKLNRLGVSDDGWSKIDKDGEIVYCSSSYLTIKEPVKEEVYPLTYSDETGTITITKEWYDNAWAYIAHLEFSDYSRFGTECANGKYNNGYETTSSVAKRLNAIFAVNGCFSAPYLDYGVIRSGVVCNDKKYGYVAGYSSVSGLFGNLVEDKYNGPSLTELAADGTVTDTFCFGPAFLVNGEIIKSFDTSRAQRTFIGSNGNPGDIWIVVSDGRYNDGKSAGLTYNQCAQLLLDKGCTYGIPLDGGGSSTMVFNGKILNANAAKERAVVDFIYFK